MVPILRFIDTQNGDGSYTYGYESGDGTYKLETRFANGEVKGKYGYYDPTGELREVEYGAGSNGGFEPKANGLVVAPPTFCDENVYEEEEELPFQEPAQPAARQNFANFQEQDNRRVVIRKRPSHSRSEVPQVPQQRARPAFRPQPAQEQPRFVQEQPRFNAQAAPAAARFAPVPQGTFDPTGGNKFFDHPYISGFNVADGSFSVTYGR